MRLAGVVIRTAIDDRNIQIEIVIGPTTKIGSESQEGASVLRELRSEIKKASHDKDLLVGGSANHDPERISPDFVDQATRTRTESGDGK